MPGGNIGPGVIVDFSAHLHTIEDPDLEAGTVRVQAGAIARDVAEKIEASGFFFPALPSSARRCTIGGMVANNASGARSFKYGSVRQAVVALDVILADGTVVRLSRDDSTGQPPSSLVRALPDVRDTGTFTAGWPRVRKNSSGYALDHWSRTGRLLDLMVGAEGTLGCITGVTLRLRPPPEARGLLLLRAEDPARMSRLIEIATENGASACEFFGRRFMEIAGFANDPVLRPFTRRSEALFLVEVDGPEDEVTGKIECLRSEAAVIGSPTRVARSPEARRRLWQLRHAASPTIADEAARGRVSMQFIEDSVVPADRLTAYLHGVQEILAEQEMDAVIFGHAGDGNAHVNPLVDVRCRGWRERVRRVLYATAELVADLGGTLSGEHGDGRLRAPLLASVWDDAMIRAFRQVKEAFDPQGILNPGVILPMEDQDPLEGIGAGFPRD